MLHLKKTDASNKPAYQYVSPTFVDHENNDGSITDREWRNIVLGDGLLQSIHNTGSNNFSSDASEIRNSLVAYFSSEAGKVPWQDKIVNR